MLGRIFAALPDEVRARRELAPLRFAATREASARQAYYKTLARNTELTEAARVILDAAEADGVAMLPLKGALFAEALWGDAGARPMSDLDLAVRPDDLPRAVALMQALGYRPAFAAQARFSARHGHDVAFAGERGIVVEVHHRLFHELAVEAAVEPLFERAVTMTLWGRERRVPSWDDHLFVAAVHAATHAFESPLWVVDVALLCARADVDSARVEAARRRARVAFGAAMGLAHRALPARVPSLSDDSGARALLIQRLLRDRLAAPPSRVASLLVRALLTDRPRDAVGEILRKLELRAVELGERLR